MARSSFEPWVNADTHAGDFVDDSGRLAIANQPVYSLLLSGVGQLRLCEN
jgi:hypothetical protein